MFSYLHLESTWRAFPWWLLHLGRLSNLQSILYIADTAYGVAAKIKHSLSHLQTIGSVSSISCCKKINWKSSELWKSVIDMRDSRVPFKTSSLLDLYVVMTKMILNYSFGEETNSWKPQSHFFSPFQKDKSEKWFYLLEMDEMQNPFSLVCQWKIQTCFLLVMSVLFVLLTIALVKVFYFLFFLLVMLR